MASDLTPLAVGRPRRGDGGRARVLLGATDAATRASVSGAVRAACLDLAHVADADALLEATLERRPDLVILDVAMPRTFEACAELRASASGALTPVIILVEPDDTASLMAGDDAGVTDFVIKPVDETLLARRLSYVLRATETLRDYHLSQTRLARVQRIAHLGSWLRGLEDGRLRCDAELSRTLRLQGDESGDPLATLLGRVHLEDRLAVESAMASMRPHRLEYRIVLETPGAPPEQRTLQQEAWLVQDEPGGAIELMGTVLDITQLKEAQHKVARLAYYDVLTGLPNRAFLKEYLQLSLARGRRFDGSIGVLALDLDFFKRVNDSLGHPAGDELLTVIAQRIGATIRTTDAVSWSGPADPQRRIAEPDNAVARIGGDEFIVVLSDLRVPEDAAVVARRIIEAVAQPVPIAGGQVFTGCSVGIAIYPENGDSPDLLMKNADTALYHAKEQGRGTFHFFSEALADRARRRMEIESGLHAAIAADRLCLHYQPKVDLHTREVSGCEALIRWPIGDGTFIPPDQFIPVAEDTGLILEIGAWVLRTACRQAKAWAARLARPLAIAVNVSSRQLSDPNFERIVTEVLAETGLAPQLLEIELTEGAVMKDAHACAVLLGRLRARDVRISLDDFGTGYSSLSYLARLPIDQIKIDRSFVRDLGGEGSSSAAIVRAIVALARSGKLRVVAEGVETEEQLGLLAAAECDEAQGYLFARPMAADAFEAWLASAPDLGRR